MQARGEDPAWLFWLSLVGLLALIGGALAAAPMIAKMMPEPPSAEVRIERELLENAQTGDVYRAIKRTFPEDFSRIVAVAADASRKGTPDSALDPLIASTLAEAEARHRRQLMQAPHESLAAFRAAEIRLVEYLHEKSPDLCANYVLTGQVSFNGREDLSTEALDVMRVAAWEAYAAGRDHPARRMVKDPGIGEWRKIAQSMAAEGAPEDDINALLSGNGFNVLPEMTQCETGIDFYRAIQSLPPERGDAVSAYLLSRGG